MGYLPAFSYFQLPHRVPRRLISEAYQSSSQRSIPTTVNSGSSTLQKDDLLNCWTSSSDISGYHADFHEGHGTVGAWQGARHGMCELTNGMGGGNGMGTTCYVNWPYKDIFTSSGVPRNFVRGGSTNSVEDGENGDLGAVAP